jgi:hypothetical protein
MIDWSKVFEVCSSGVLGVYLVMFLLMVLTQLSTRSIDLVEKGLNRRSEPEPKPVQKEAVQAGGNANV